MQTMKTEQIGEPTMMLYNNTLYRFQLKEKEILTFEWTERTAEMSYEDFQEACQNYAGYAVEHRVTGLLIDTRAFLFTLPDDYDAWVREHVHPRYHRGGVQKFAYVMPPGALAHTEDLPPASDGFSTRYFDDLDAAAAWLLDRS